MPDKAIQGRNVVGLWSAQGTKGVPVTPATAFGTAAVELDEDAGQENIRSIGSANVIEHAHNLTSTSWSSRIAQVQSKALMLKAVRSNGELPWITVGQGYKTDGSSPTRWARQISDAKVGQLVVAVEFRGPLRAEFSGLGLKAATLTSLNPANLSAKTFMWHQCILTKGGTSFPVRGFTSTINHNLEYDGAVPGEAPAAGSERIANDILEGDEEISGEITIARQVSEDMSALGVTEFDLVLTATNGDGDVITLTLADSAWGRQRFSGEPGTRGAMFTLPFTAKTFTLV